MPMRENVRGRCPNGCGETLFLGEGGYVTCSWSKCPSPHAASSLLDKFDVNEKIELKAIFTKDGKFLVTDQNGREFDFVDEYSPMSYEERQDKVMVRFELEAPHMLGIDRPRVNLTFSIPLEAEEEMPAFVQEIIRDRLSGTKNN